MFTLAYFGVIYKLKDYPYEPLRIGFVGSLTNLVSECVFHVLDTVNVRSKAVVASGLHKKPTVDIVKIIYCQEGLYGFGRGLSVCYYASVFSGFTYFFAYKSLK